jgi:hypothetical protein
LLEPDRQSIPIRTILTRRGLSINVPAIPFSPSSRKGPSWISAADRKRESGNQGRGRSGGRRRPRVDFGQRQAVRNDRLSQLLVRIHADMSGIM